MQAKDLLKRCNGVRETSYQKYTGFALDTAAGLPGIFCAFAGAYDFWIYWPHRKCATLSTGNQASQLYSHDSFRLGADFKGSKGKQIEVPDEVGVKILEMSIKRGVIKGDHEEYPGLLEKIKQIHKEMLVNLSSKEKNEQSIEIKEIKATEKVAQSVTPIDTEFEILKKAAQAVNAKVWKYELDGHTFHVIAKSAFWARRKAIKELRKTMIWEA